VHFFVGDGSGAFSAPTQASLMTVQSSGSSSIVRLNVKNTTATAAEMMIGAANAFTLAGNSLTAGVVGTESNHALVFQTNTVARGMISNGGNFLFGHTGTSNGLLSIDGTAARTILTERNTTAATAGNNLTIKVGGAIAGTADLAGGKLILASGVPTGTGRSWTELNCFTTALSTGTTDGTSFTCKGEGVYLALTDGSATNVVSLTLANNTVQSVIIDYAVEVYDGTDLQVEDGQVICRAINKAGTVSGNTCTETSTQTLGAGTLTTTWAISAANPAVVSLNADTSLTASTGYPRLRFFARDLAHQAMAMQ
jgi:hypothetical protein